MGVVDIVALAQDVGRGSCMGIGGTRESVVADRILGCGAIDFDVAEFGIVCKAVRDSTDEGVTDDLIPGKAFRGDGLDRPPQLDPSAGYYNRRGRGREVAREEVPIQSP